MDINRKSYLILGIGCQCPCRTMPEILILLNGKSFPCQFPSISVTIMSHPHLTQRFIESDIRPAMKVTHLNKLVRTISS
jgi:hypothetical protein